MPNPRFRASYIDTRLEDDKVKVTTVILSYVFDEFIRHLKRRRLYHDFVKGLMTFNTFYQYKGLKTERAVVKAYKELYIDRYKEQPRYSICNLCIELGTLNLTFNFSKYGYDFSTQVHICQDKTAYSVDSLLIEYNGELTFINDVLRKFKDDYISMIETMVYEC